MFQLRREHLEGFERACEPGFEKSVMGHLRKHHEDAVNGLADDDLHKRVRFGLARARKYGLTFQCNLTAFVAHMFEVAPNFDEHPVIRGVLCDNAVEPDSRMDLLVERVEGQHWLEAKRNGNPELWGQANG